MAFQTQVYTLKRGDGAFRSAAKTGLLTVVAAGTATAGHIWTARWAPSTNRLAFAVISRFRARWFTISGFTGAQEVGLDLFKATANTSAHTGGNAVTPTKKRTTFAAAIMTGRIADTGELTNVATTLSTDPLASASFAELAAGAAVPKGVFEIGMGTNDLDRHPIVLAANEGLVLRNSILMGAGGTARVVVELDWLEVERY